MEELIEMARKLGKKVAAHERTVLLKKAQEKVDADAGAAKLVEEFQQQAQKIQALEQEQKPIEVEDKHKLRDIEQKIIANENLAELTRCQADFVELMHKIKGALDNELKID